MALAFREEIKTKKTFLMSAYTKDIEKAFDHRNQEVAWWNAELYERGYRIEPFHQNANLKKTPTERREHNITPNRNFKAVMDRAMGFDYEMRAVDESGYSMPLFFRHSNDSGCFFKLPSDITSEEYFKFIRINS